MEPGVETNLINEYIGWYEQVISLSGLSPKAGQARWRLIESKVMWGWLVDWLRIMMGFVSPKEGLGTIAYKARECAWAKKGQMHISYPFEDFSKVTYVCGDGWLND